MQNVHELTRRPSPRTNDLADDVLSLPPHVRLAEDILRDYDVNPAFGLSTRRAIEVLAQNGPNQLKPPEKPSRIKIFIRQLTNAMNIILFCAVIVSFATRDWIAAAVVGSLIVLNVSVGYTQEWKAEKVLAALSAVGSPVATVIRHDPLSKSREGKSSTIASQDIVVGDIVIIKIGDIVPADARVLTGHISNLECDESLLTGESLPVAKVSDHLEEANSPVGDRTNMVYSGSQVTKGRAKCVVTMTGMQTELGKIAEALEKKQSTNEEGWRYLRYRIKVSLGLANTTPLQIKLNKLAYWLLIVAILLALVVISSTGFRRIPPSIATYAVAAAVSLLPESLTSVTTLTLTVACRELAKRNALIRRMDAVETLGGVHNICSDKTGTITLGRMVVRKVWIPVDTAFVPQGSRASYDSTKGQMYVVESGTDPFYPRGIIRAIRTEDAMALSNEEDDESDDGMGEDVVRMDSLEPAFQELIHGTSLNNMATLHKGHKENGWEANGDPTEIALQVLAHKAGRGKPHLTALRRRPRHQEPLVRVVSRASENIQTHRSELQLDRTQTAQSDGTSAPMIDGHYEMLVEHSFDSTVKRMSTVWEFIPENDADGSADYDLVVYVKGAVERIIDRCTHIGLGDRRLSLTEGRKEEIMRRMDSIAAEGLRVLCIAGKYLPYSTKDQIKNMTRDEVESDCCLLGLVGIYDPPRPESKGAVLEALRAGIVVRMLTGDHAATASSIARSVGILNNTHGPTAVMTGQEFDRLTDAEIDAIPELPVVLSRCSPETKTRMVDAIHRRGQKTVMTGDGVNDSPALKRADVGVAMGLNGSDVAKGASDIVLADDNFSTIVRAIRKGRAIFQNFTKALVYLLSGNVAEVTVIMVGLAFRRHGVAVYPVAPVAALWINTIAAGPPGFALGVEPTGKDVMNAGPEAYQYIFTPSWYMDTIGYGILMGAQTLANFVIVQYGTGNGMADIDPKCNDHLVGLQPGCEVVFRARGTAFATLQLLLMAHALTCKHLTQSLFHMNLLDNTLLLWSTGCLALTTFPLVYIPAINDRVFQLSGLTWQWGLVVAQLVFYFAAAEMYKLAKRIYYRRRSRRETRREVEKDAGGKEFHVTYTMDV